MTDEELYKRALDKVGDPAKAKELVAAYRASKASPVVAATPKPATPAPHRRMASAEPPKGGPVGTVTRPAAAPAKEPVVAPLAPARASDYATSRASYGSPSPGMAREVDERQAAEDAAWAQRNPVYSGYARFREGGKTPVEVAQRAPLEGGVRRVARGLGRAGGEVLDAMHWYGGEMKEEGDKQRAVVSALTPEVGGPRQVSVPAAKSEPASSVKDYATAPAVTVPAPPPAPTRTPTDDAKAYLKTIGYTDDGMKGVPDAVLVRAAADKRAQAR